jgi:hypothetical protein
MTFIPGHLHGGGNVSVPGTSRRRLLTHGYKDKSFRVPRLALTPPRQPAYMRAPLAAPGTVRPDVIYLIVYRRSAYRETDLSTLQTRPQAPAWFPRPHGNRWRPQGYRQPPRQGPRQTLCLIFAPRALKV